MKTYYIRLYQMHSDPVWGIEATACRTPLIRVTRNRLMKSAWEWVGGSAWTPYDHEFYCRVYPIAEQVDLVGKEKS